MLGWDWFLSGNVSTQLQGGYLYELIETGPQGWLGEIDYTGCDQFPPEVCAYNRDRPQHLNIADNTTWYNGGAYQNDKRWRVQLDPTVTIRGTAAGQHEVKFGIQSQFNYRTRVIQTPGRQTYRDRSTLHLARGPVRPGHQRQRGLLPAHRSEDVDVKEKAFGVGIFAQDRWWTPIEQITVIPGLRADYGTSYDRNGRQVTELFALAPRLGITGNLTRDGRNVLFAHYGRTTETLTLLVASGIDALEAGRNIEYQWSNTPATSAPRSPRAAVKGASRSRRPNRPPRRRDHGRLPAGDLPQHGGLGRIHVQEVLQHLGRDRDQPHLGSHRLARDRLEGPGPRRPGCVALLHA